MEPRFGNQRRWERVRRSALPLPLVAMLLAVVSPACSSDDQDPSRPADAGGDERDVFDGPLPGGSGAYPEPPPGCEPLTDPDDDACLACLTRSCCDELFLCGGSGEVDGAPTYGCYQSFFPCVQRCFAREIRDGSTASSDEIVEACGPECAPSGPSEYDPPLENFLACSVRESRSMTQDVDGGSEGSSGDEDGGRAAMSCAEVCFAAWREDVR